MVPKMGACRAGGCSHSRSCSGGVRSRRVPLRRLASRPRDDLGRRPRRGCRGRIGSGSHRVVPGRAGERRLRPCGRRNGFGSPRGPDRPAAPRRQGPGRESRLCDPRSRRPHGRDLIISRRRDLRHRDRREGHSPREFTHRPRAGGRRRGEGFGNGGGGIRSPWSQHPAAPPTWCMASCSWGTVLPRRTMVQSKRIGSSPKIPRRTRSPLPHWRAAWRAERTTCSRSHSATKGLSTVSGLFSSGHPTAGCDKERDRSDWPEVTPSEVRAHLLAVSEKLVSGGFLQDY